MTREVLITWEEVINALPGARELVCVQREGMGVLEFLRFEPVPVGVAGFGWWVFASGREFPARAGDYWARASIVRRVSDQAVVLGEHFDLGETTVLVARCDAALFAEAPALLDVAWRLVAALRRNQFVGRTEAGAVALSELGEDAVAVLRRLEEALDEQ